MDSRDFRKKWLNLQESWNEEANVNVNATKAEKLEEKRKLPDALKAHQFGKKKDAAEETDKKEDKGPEKDKKDDKKADKKDDKKPSFLKKKATEAKKVVKPVKKVKEDGAAAANGATTSAAVGGAKGTCPDAHIGAPERLKKRNESKLFSHFKKYMAEAGLPVDMDAPAGIPGEDVAGDAVAELTGEEPVGEPGLDAPADDAANVLADIQARFPGKKIRICVEADPTEPFSTEDVAAAEAAIAAVPEEVEGLEGDEGAEEMLAPEAGGELPVDQDIADEVKTEAVDGVSVKAGDKYQHKTGGIWTVRNPAGSRGIVMIDPEGSHLLVTNKQLASLFTPVANESCSMREDEEEDMGAADGVEEVPTGDELDAEGGEEALGGELGAEEHASEASPEALSMTPEQWTEFLAGGAGEEGLGDELAGATDVADAGEGEDSDSESNKSEDTLG
jgi:hypothetical protein